MIFNVPGVWFNGKHSYRDYGMFLSERPDLGSPQPKTVAVDVPGANGVLDYTEAATGTVKYENRQCVFTFAKQLDATLQQQFMSQLRTALHGQTVGVELDEDAGWVYTGRATVDFGENEDWKLKIVITVDAYPYGLSKTWRHEHVTVPKTGSEYVAVPLIPQKSEFGVKDTYFRFTQSQRQSIDFSNTASIGLNWKAESTPYPTGRVYLKDADGVTASASLNVADESAMLSIFYSPFDVLDKSHIAKMTVENIPDCDALITIGVPSSLSTVHLDGRPVSPIIHQHSAAGVTLVLNNTIVDITSEYFESDDLMLWPGDNYVGISYVNPAAETDKASNWCELIFREGKL